MDLNQVNRVGFRSADLQEICIIENINYYIKYDFCVKAVTTHHKMTITHMKIYFIEQCFQNYRNNQTSTLCTIMKYIILNKTRLLQCIKFYCVFI